MPIQGGPIEFEVTGTNSSLINTLADSKRAVEDLVRTVEAGGKGMDGAFDDAAKTIEEGFAKIDVASNLNLKSLRELEKEYEKLNKITQIAGTTGSYGGVPFEQLKSRRDEIKEEIEMRRQLQQNIEDTADDLAKEEQGMQSLRARTQENANAHVALSTQLRKVKDAMAEMETAGQRDSEAYSKLQSEAGRLTSALSDVRQQARVLGSNTSTLDGIMSGLQGVSGAFTVAQGSVGLFTTKNEELQKTMLKVQSLMSITMGIQQVSNAVNQNSAFRLTVLARIKETLAKSTDKFSASLTKLGVAQKAANAIASVSTTLLAGGLVAAIAVLGVAIDRALKKIREAKEQAQEFYDTTAREAVKPIESVEEMSVAWVKLGNNVSEKERYIKDHAKAFNELGVSVKSVADAENLLIANKNKFIESEMAKAKAAAARSLAAKVAEELISAQLAIEDTPKTKEQYVGGGQYSSGTLVTVMNPEWERLQGKIDKATARLQKFYEVAADESKKSQSILDATGLSGLNETQSNAKDTSPSSNNAAAQERRTYEQLLNDKRSMYKQYFSWINSADKETQEAAQTRFASLIAAGETYMQYLLNERKRITEEITGGKDTEEYKNQLATINDAIASETKDTVIDQFEAQLQEQMAQAEGIEQKLAAIESMRASLANGKSELALAENAILDKEKNDLIEKNKEETNALLDHYAEYLQEKITFEKDYAEKSEQLNTALEEAKTNDDKRIAVAAIAALNREKQKYNKQTGDSSYDALVREYQSYEQKRQEIAKEYDDKIATARLHADKDLEQRLIAERQDLLSANALQEIQNSDAYKKLFENMDDLTTGEIRSLISKIQSMQFQLGVNIDKDDLKKVVDQLNKAMDEIAKRNPFAQFGDAAKSYRSDDETSTDNLMSSYSQVVGIVSSLLGSFSTIADAVTDGTKKCQEAYEYFISGMEGVAKGFDDIVTGIASENPIKVMVGLIEAAKGAEKALSLELQSQMQKMEQYQNTLDQFTSAYERLQNVLKNCLGEDQYAAQSAMITNLNAQLYYLQQLALTEADRKDKDPEKLKDYGEQMENIRQEIINITADITESITSTSAKSLADELADSIADIFTQGFDNASVQDAVDSVTNKVLQNAVKNALKQQLLAKPLQEAIAALQKAMGFDENGNGSFDGLTEDERTEFKNKVSSISSAYTEAMKMYGDLFNDVTGTDTSTLSGAIKGASQDSIDLLAGQTNAVRINQVATMEMIRAQLMHIESIDQGVGSTNMWLETIYNTVKGKADEARSQGLTS